MNSYRDYWYKNDDYEKETRPVWPPIHQFRSGLYQEVGEPVSLVRSIRVTGFDRKVFEKFLISTILSENEESTPSIVPTFRPRWRSTQWHNLFQHLSSSFTLSGSPVLILFLCWCPVVPWDQKPKRDGTLIETGFETHQVGNRRFLKRETTSIKLNLKKILGTDFVPSSYIYVCA